MAIHSAEHFNIIEILTKPDHLHNNKLSLSKKGYPEDGSKATVSVSYTHLDVYKRQLL